MVLATQMQSQQFDAPHRRSVAQPEWVASQLIQDPYSSNPWGRQRPTASRRIGQGGDVRSLQVELDPVIDGLHADVRQLRDLADGVPLGHPQHGLHTLEEAFIRNAL